MAPTILIVDDDPVLVEMLTFVLGRSGFGTKSAQDGASALGSLSSEPFDLVVLDVMLPDMDGFEICRRIRRLPNIADIPVLMLSARTQVLDKVTGLEAGADDYLAKPADPKEIVARVKALLARARRPRIHTGRVIAFMGAKGGVGTTTTAVNVALALAQIQRRVVFVEMGRLGLSAAWMLALEPAQNLLELAGAEVGAGKGRLSMSALETCIVRHVSGLDYLPARGQAACGREFPPGVLEETSALLQQSYDAVIIDMGSGADTTCNEILLHSEVVVPVSEHDSLSTWHLGLVLEWLRATRLNAKVSGFVLVQRSVAALHDSPSALASEMGLGILEVIPAAPEALYHCHSRREPLFMADPGHPLAVSCAELAQRLETDPIEISPSLQP